MMKPSWSPDMHGWALRFDVRAKLPSKKNFILGGPCSDDLSLLGDDNNSNKKQHVDDVVYLRFGKLSKDSLCPRLPGTYLLGRCFRCRREHLLIPSE